MNGKYKPGQRGFLTGGNTHLIKEAMVQKYSGGFTQSSLKMEEASKLENPESTLLAKKRKQ